jgi:hypothetical protein
VTGPRFVHGEDIGYVDRDVALLLSERNHYLRGCPCTQRGWCVPHGWAGIGPEDHGICADHEHVAPTPSDAEDVQEAEAREAYLRPIAKGGQPRPVTPCDTECGAPLDPRTEEELRLAVAHWRDHGYLSGCSHAR